MGRRASERARSTLVAHVDSYKRFLEVTEELKDNLRFLDDLLEAAAALDESLKALEARTKELP